MWQAKFELQEPNSKSKFELAVVEIEVRKGGSRAKHHHQQRRPLRGSDEQANWEPTLAIIISGWLAARREISARPARSPSSPRLLLASGWLQLAAAAAADQLESCERAQFASGEARERSLYSPLASLLLLLLLLRRERVEQKAGRLSCPLSSNRRRADRRRFASGSSIQPKEEEDNKKEGRRRRRSGRHSQPASQIGPPARVARRSNRRRRARAGQQAGSLLAAASGQHAQQAVRVPKAAAGWSSLGGDIGSIGSISERDPAADEAEQSRTEPN